MLSLDVVNRQGNSVGKVEIDPAEFGGEINRQLLHDVVLMYLANQRAGTHSTLRRGAAAGPPHQGLPPHGTPPPPPRPHPTHHPPPGGPPPSPPPRPHAHHPPPKRPAA